MWNHGSITTFEHDVVGSTERMDTLQAAVLRGKLDPTGGAHGARAAA